MFFFLILPRPPRSTLTYTLFPYPTLFRSASPEWSESLQIYTYGLIADALRTPLYPVHISAAHTVDTVKDLKAKGMRITGETLTCFLRSEEHTSELQSLMRNSYAVFCLKKKKYKAQRT